MTKKMITVKEFAIELKDRIEKNQTVDCCKIELLNLAALASKKMGSEKIEVNWVD
ncbi:MAG: hypothetical protein JXJ22_15335 [Bacteroidales bacterium]|nr:hypothetical protein [Bacteroidales bacterium]